MLRVNNLNGYNMSIRRRDVAFAISVTPYIEIYPLDSGADGAQGGFGTKYDNPTTLPTGAVECVTFSPSGNFIAIGMSSSPYIHIYEWGPGGFGSKIANPSTLPAGTVNDIKFTNDEKYIFLADASTPYVYAYDWSNAGFGTKWGDPASLMTSAATSVDVSSSGRDPILTNSVSPYIHGYVWLPGISGFMSKYSNPATLPTGIANAVAYHPNSLQTGNAVIVVAHDTTPFVSAYPVNGAFGTKLANPASLPVGNCKGVAFSPSGNVIALGSSVSPYIQVYTWSASGFGTKYANPASLPLGTCNKLEFSRDGSFLIATGTSLSVYEWSDVTGFGGQATNKPFSSANDISIS